MGEGDWNWNTIILYNTAIQCRFDKFEDEQNLGVKNHPIRITESSPGALPDGNLSTENLRRDDVPRRAVPVPCYAFGAPGLWHFDEGPLVRPTTILAFAKAAQPARINAVINLKFLALWSLLCRLCQASASSTTSGGRHGVGHAVERHTKLPSTVA